MPFWSPDADRAFIEAFETHYKQTEKRILRKCPYHINDPNLPVLSLINTSNYGRNKETQDATFRDALLKNSMT